MESWIHYLKGDATVPIGNGAKYIVHLCNNLGLWGAGFVLGVSQKWPEPKKSYLQWYHSEKDFSLGKIQFVPVEKDITIINMVAQKGIESEDDLPPIRYEALKECLNQIANAAKENKASVHMPRIGSGLAGGNWEEVEKIIQKTLIINQVPTYIYDL